MILLNRPRIYQLRYIVAEGQLVEKAFGGTS